MRVFKYKPKKGYRRRAGHRQELTRLEVTDVRLLTRKPAAKAETKPARRDEAGGEAEGEAGGEEAGGQEAGGEDEAGGEEAGGQEARREGQAAGHAQDLDGAAVVIC